MRIMKLLGVGLIAWTALCSALAVAQDGEAMLVKASELTKLTSAVESAVRYKSPSGDLDEAGLLKFAVEHDPSLLAKFDAFKVRVQSKERHASVLVCSQDGTRGLLEDAGCTAELDHHLWEAAAPAPCEFALDLAAVCAARAEAVAMASSAVVLEATDDGDPLIEIAEVAWTGDVSAATRAPSRSLQVAPVRSPLALWMRIKGRDAALERLEKAGKLPIKHRWFRQRFTGVSAEGETDMTDSITLNAGRKELLRGLRREVAERGFFDWRTWSSKASPGVGRWSVTVLYADNTPVLCGESKPCRYFITVK